MRLLLTLICFLGYQTGFSGNESIPTQTDKERALSVIWIEIPGISGLASLSEEDLNMVGGLFLPRPLEASDALLLGTPNLPPLAIQLDTRLNPAPGFVKELPDLEVMSSIRDQHLQEEYIRFLWSVGKGLGITYLVLPEIDPSWKHASEFFKRMNAYDSTFFISKSALSTKPISSKKELKAQLAARGFWVVSDQNYPGVKALLLETKRLPDPDAAVSSWSDEKRMKADTFPLRDHIPTKLAFEITREAIIPLQKGNVLPLERDTVSFLTANPTGPLAEMLSKYAYLLTTPEGISQSRSPVILDGTFDSIPMDLSSRTVIFFGTRSNAEKWTSIANAILLIPLHREWNDYLIPQLLFGAGSASGRLADHITQFEEFENNVLKSNETLGYMPPGLLGIDDRALEQIRELIKEAIQERSTPGCQIGIAIGGSIVLEEAIGFLTYDSLIGVENETLYDIASVTKVTGTLLAVMKLYEEGKLSLDEKLSTYLPEYGLTDKSNITIRSILAHQSGLKGYIPYWRRTTDPDFYEFLNQEFSNPLNLSLPLVIDPNQVRLDSLKSWILNTPVNQRRDSSQTYRYSDIGFMILHQVIEHLSGMSLEQYLITHFYSKMELKRIAYNPLLKGFPRSEIAPTEFDEDLRNELIWGEVHDQNAKVFGGVAGHAGLFANAHELLVIQQMLLNGGTYNETQFLKVATIEHFNQRYFEKNRRGLGWDKPGGTPSNASRLVSDTSFGHSGFTGCLIWSDPAYNISLVFLSNRIYPNSSNTRLITKDIRARIQTIIYEAIISNWIN